MEKQTKFIAFDLGAESGRCMVATLCGRKLEMEEIHRFPTKTIRQEDGIHWDITSIYDEIVDGLRKAGKAEGPSFDGIGIDTWGVDYALIDDGGALLEYPFHYRDGRTDGMMEEAFRIVPKETLYSLTGIQFVQINTLFQLLAEKKNKPDLLSSARTLLLLPDFLNYKLSGVRKAEFSIASTTGLADPNTRNWCWKLIDAFGFPRRIFPEMVEPGTILGTLLPSVAKKSGLNVNIPIIATTGHDTASAVVSVPSAEENWAYLSSGTWSLIGVELPKPILTSEAMRYNFTNEGGFERTTRFLKNIIGLWPVQESRRFWKKQSADLSYSELVSKAQQAGQALSWVNLDEQSFLKGGNVPEIIVERLRTTNQPFKTGVGFITRVILESLAFKYRKAIKELESVSGKKIDILYAVGGGTRNELLMQLTTDAIGRRVIAGPIEGAAVGNIGVQAIAVGAVNNLHEWREIVANSFDLKTYEPTGSAYFDNNEERYDRVVAQESSIVPLD